MGKIKNIIIDILKNTGVLLLYACFLFIEFRFYGHIPLPIQLLAIALLIVFTYFVASPLWMKSFPRKRNFAIRLMLGIIIFLSYAWDFLRSQHSNHVFSVEIFIVPIILTLLFFSLKESVFVLMSCVVISAVNVLWHMRGINGDAVFSGVLEVGICTLLIFIMNRALKVRSRLINKQNIFVENSRALMIGIDRTGKIDLCNPAMCRLLKMKQDEVLDHFFWEVGAKVSGEAVDQIFQLLAQRKKTEQFELQVPDGQGTSTFLADTYPVEDDGLVSGIIVVLNDITDRKTAEKKLYELSVTDDLTKLANRRHFERRLDEEIIRSNRYGRPLSLLLIDLDHFKDINDTYGHRIGDLVLSTVAKQLESHVRDTDVVARWGGEEFAVLMPETELKEAEKIGIRLLKAVRETPIPVPEEHGEPIMVTFSAGVTTQSSGIVKEQIIESVDTALYESKNNGRNQVTLGL
ncbi:sensor domain-containing diguanylate cyclase [Paenibacillus macerans]|uniref:sensor domain-containing diguanylate cyclase n=1 Tax=Paenibacillus macerans TaxID=44252 RepID=UPI00203DBFD1|nr:sensor domain-containing diguanylate cyclase [Paenibacillus macerans]MCM3700258.1 sensor domain-containing diguanylate cyclase [Paenibacillus macerans]